MNRHAERCEAIVVGGGLAGLSAAVRAAELGLKAIVLEQGIAKYYPCNSRYAGGVMHLAFEDIGLPPAELAHRLSAKLPADLDAALIDAIANNSARVAEWLIARARARFVRGGPAEWQRHCLAPIRPLRPGLVWPGRGPDAMLRALEESLGEAGGHIRRGVTVMEVSRQSDGDFCLDVTSQDGGRSCIRTSALVLADGGFLSVDKLAASRLGWQGADVLERNARSTTGLAMRTAKSLGLAVWPNDRFYGHIVARHALVSDQLWPWPTLDDLAMAGLVIGQDGCRIGGTARNGIDLANAIAAQPANNRAFVLVDEAIWNQIGPKTRVVPCNPGLEQLGATIFRADRLDTLSSSADVEFGPMQACVSNHGGLAASGQFLLIPVIAGATYTMGGLAVTPSGNVKSLDGAEVSGLFAAGGSVGGAEGGKKTFYLGGLAKAAITGFVAGEAAARAAKTA